MSNISSNQLSALARPRFIALDSSHLGKLARDYFSRDVKKRVRARNFQTNMGDIGCVLFACWHHITELLRHRDPKVVTDRLQYLKTVPLMGRVRGFSNDGMPGSIIDIHCHEISAALQSHDPNAVAVRDQVAAHLIGFGSGEDVVRPFLDTWRILQPELWRQEAREREVVAISRSKAVDFSHTKMSEWLTGGLRSPEDAAKRLRHFAQLLGQDIKTRGDKRIPSPADTARRFFDQVTADASKIFSAEGSPALQILNAVGIERGDITDCTTLGEVSDLAAFRHKLRLINQKLQMPWDRIRQLSEGALPSFVILDSLRRYGQDQPERKGSELTDGYLSVLSAYVDLTFVDKRVLENFKRARQHSTEFSRLVRRVEKTANYWDIPSVLNEAFR